MNPFFEDFIMATIHIPTPLRPYTDGQASVDVAGATVAEALNALTTAHAGLATTGSPHECHIGRTLICSNSSPTNTAACNMPHTACIMLRTYHFSRQ